MGRWGRYEIQFRLRPKLPIRVVCARQLESDEQLTLNIGLRYDVSLPETERHKPYELVRSTMTNPLNGGTISYPIRSPERRHRPLLGGEVFNVPVAHQLAHRLKTYTTIRFAYQSRLDGERGVRDLYGKLARAPMVVELRF